MFLSLQHFIAPALDLIPNLQTGGTSCLLLVPKVANNSVRLLNIGGCD